MNKFYFLWLGISLLLSASTSAQTLTQDTAQASQLCQKANTEYSRGRFIAGNQLLRQAATLYEKHQLWELSLQCQTPIVTRFARRRDLDSALNVMQQLTSRLAQPYLKNSLAEATYYLDLSEGFYLAGNADQAAICLDSAKEVGKAFLTDKNKFSADYYLRQAQLCSKQQQYDKALELGLKARRIFRSLPPEEFPDIAHVTELLVDNYIGMDLAKKATTEAEYLLKMAKQYFPPNHKTLGESYAQAAIAYSSFGEMEKAFSYFNIAEAIARNNGQDSLGLGILLANTGITYKDYIYQMRRENPALAMRYLDTAEAKLKEGIAIEKAILGKKHNNLSGAYRGLGYVYYEWPDRTGLEKALECFHLAMLSLLPNDTISDVHYVPNFNNTNTTYLDLFSLFWAIDAKITTCKGLYEKTQSPEYLKLANQYIDAINVLLDKRLQASDSPSDQQVILDYLAKNYKNGTEQNYILLQLTKDSSYAWQSFLFSERSKASMLFSALKARTTENLGGISPELLTQESQLQKNIAAWRKRSTDAIRARDQANIIPYQDSLIAALQNYETFNKKLQASTPEYYQLKYKRDIANMNIQTLQKQLKLDKETVVLEYYVQFHKIFVYQIYHDHFKVQKITIRHDTLNNNIKAFSKALQTPLWMRDAPEQAYKEITQRGHNLHTWLIDSLQIPSHIKRLVIIPDGQLNQIPFEVLLQKPAPTDKMDYKKLDYLLNRYIITYGYSADLLAHNLAQKSAATRGVAAFVASYQLDSLPMVKKEDIKRKNLSPLPFTMKELEHLQKLFPDGRFYSGEQASEKEFKQLISKDANYHILHFAMHGLVDEKYPLGSSLAFTATKDTAEDDFLYSYEITHERLNADLVVLSACETGFGKYENGEGVISLARSFMYAGAPSVVMTLWAINDQTTPMIMEQFYNQLKKGANKDEALRFAKLEYLKNSNGLGAHPAFWAAFIHNGNYLPIPFGQKTSALFSVAMGAGILLLLIGGAWFFNKNTRKNTIS